MQRIKWLLLPPVLLWGLWVLLSPSDDQPEDSSSKTASATQPTADRKYVLSVSPGGMYMPGFMPFSIGKPLQGFDQVARRFEELYPDTAIKYVNTPTVREWVVTQLSAGQAPDILQVNVEDIWQDTQKGWYVPLDEYLNKPNPFAAPGAPGSRQWWDIFKYQTITRGKAAPDGKNYCISLDMVETGIFYNKDIFKKVGLKPPNDWNEFLAIHKKLRDAGYAPMQLEAQAITDWGVDLVFDQLYSELLPGIDLVKDPYREPYLQGYLDWDEIIVLHEKGFFTRRDPRYGQVFRILREWREATGKPLGLATALFRDFVTQRTAMMWDGSWTVQRLSLDPDMRFEWGVFYLPPLTKDQSPYADGHPMCVIGGSGDQYVVTNSAFGDTGAIQTSERLKRCIAFLQFLTTPESADQVVNEAAIFLPNVVGTEPRKQLLPFDEFLKRSYTTTKWYFTFDLRFNEIALRVVSLYLEGGITQDELMDWMEKNLDSAIQTAIRRKSFDSASYERTWKELAPARAGMKGLPDGADSH